jgi:hypothetical protein
MALTRVQGNVSGTEADYAALRTALTAGAYRAGDLVRVLSPAGPDFKVEAIGALVDDAGVTITGGSWGAVRQYNGAVSVKWFGAVGDGAADDTASLLSVATFSTNNSGNTFLLPAGVYLWDGTALDFGDNFSIDAYGATLKLKAGTYASNLYGIRNRGDISYNAGTTRHKNITIRGLQIDGNLANVTLTGFSTNGLHFHQVDNISLYDVKVKDLPGDSGSLYGTIFRYCSDCQVINPQYSNTDRQNICFWESTGYIKGGELLESRFREPVLVSSENVVAFQGSHCVIEDVRVTNVNTTNGTHVIRFSGQSSGAVKHCDITGLVGSLDGVYVTFGLEHDVTLFDNDIRSCLRGLKVDTSGTKTVRSLYNRYHDCVDTIEWLAAGTDSKFVTEGDDLRDSTGQPLQVESCEDVTIKTLSIRGGASNCRVALFEKLSIDGMDVQGMTSASYSFQVDGSGTPQLYPPTVRAVTMSGNTANVFRSEENYFYMDSPASIAGAGIPLSRMGDAYMWRDTTGDIRTAFSEPAKANRDTAGTIVGTQS